MYVLRSCGGAVVEALRSAAPHGMYSGTRVSRARSHEKSGFISYSGGAPDFCCHTKKSHKTPFVWCKTVVTVWGAPDFCLPPSTVLE